MEEKAKEILKEYNQEHIINWMDKVDDKTRETIVKQVLSIDLEELKELYLKVKKGIVKKSFDITPLKSIERNRMNKDEEEECKELGQEAIKNNKFAVATMAGGQGTRLRTFWTKGKL